MASDPMGLSAGYGAGALVPTLDDLMKQRLLQQQLRDRMVQELVQKQQQDALLAQRERAMQEQARQVGVNAGFEGRRVNIAESGNQREGELHPLKVEEQKATTEGKKYGLFRTQKTDQQFDEGLAQLPKQMVPFVTTGTAARVDPFDPEGKVEFQRSMQKIGAATAGNVARRVIKRRYQDESGQWVEEYMPADEAVDMGPTAVMPPAEQLNRAASVQRGNEILKSIDELSARINTGKGVIAKIKGAAERAKAEANLNDDISEYTAVIQGFTPMIARAVGHTGVLTEQDVASVRKLFPDPTDSKSVRDRKIARVKTIWAGMNTAGNQPTQSAEPAAPAAVEQWVRDPKTNRLVRSGGQ